MAVAVSRVLPYRLTTERITHGTGTLDVRAVRCGLGRSCRYRCRTMRRRLTAQYPTKPVRIIVPVAAGGNVDIVARTFAQRFSESFGHQVIVDNRPGASSLVGTQLVAKSPPDGYTVLAIANTFASAPGIVTSAGLRSDQGFRRHIADVPHTHGARRESESAGALGAGADHACEKTSGRAQLRELGQRVDRPYRRGDVLTSGRNQNAARALQRQCTVARRSRRWPGHGHVRSDQHLHTPHQSRQDSCARR